jgi:hypothetical protein
MAAAGGRDDQASFSIIGHVDLIAGHLKPQLQHVASVRLLDHEHSIPAARIHGPLHTAYRAYCVPAITQFARTGTDKRPSPPGQAGQAAITLPLVFRTALAIRRACSSRQSGGVAATAVAPCVNPPPSRHISCQTRTLAAPGTPGADATAA